MADVRATLKLFATLGSRLPPGSQANATQISIGPTTTVAQVIADFGLLDKECHLVLLNGTFVAPDQRAAIPVAADDVISIWPPIGGGRA